jgi:hypothetical protein
MKGLAQFFKYGCQGALAAATHDSQVDSGPRIILDNSFEALMDVSCIEVSALELLCKLRPGALEPAFVAREIPNVFGVFGCIGKKLFKLFVKPSHALLGTIELILSPRFVLAKLVSR